VNVTCGTTIIINLITKGTIVPYNIKEMPTKLVFYVAANPQKTSEQPPQQQCEYKLLRRD
jgi:hypothetical protein